MKQLDSIYSMVKIADVKDRLIGNLSKGYKQRVGIAQALVGNPSILILDEPTVGLDPNQVLEMRKLVKTLSKTHSVIISSHILSEIQAIADRVVIINNGKIAAVDTITDLSRRLSGSSKLLLSFQGPLKDVSSNIRAIPGVANVATRNSNDRLHEIEITISNTSPDIRASIFFVMSKGGWPIFEFRSLDPSLEEVFLNITAGK